MLDRRSVGISDGFEIGDGGGTPRFLPQKFFHFLEIG